MKESTKFGLLAIFFFFSSIIGTVNMIAEWNKLPLALNVVVAIFLVLTWLLTYYWASICYMLMEEEDKRDKQQRFYNGDLL